MLVLTLTEDNAIDITVPPSPTARTVRIVLPGTQGTRARLGFEAERDISILRDDAVNKEKSCTGSTVSDS